MNAFQLLKNDHKLVSELFDEIESASGGSKTQLFTRLKSELDVHAHVEEKIFYPALENKQESREITLEAYEEHKVVKDLLAELATESSANEEWDAKLKVLRENVDHHVEEEEGELFDKAGDVLSDEDLERIGEEMEAEKARQLGQAPPPVARTEAKRRAPKSSGSRKNSPGVLSRLANFVGLGSPDSDSKAGRKSGSKSVSRSGKKKAAKGSKARAAKKSATKAGAKKTGAKKSTKASSKSTKDGRKPRSSRTKASKGASKKSTKSSGAAKRKTGGARKR